ncbi:hypothetical protein N7499_008207 [Penicillium canescens]|uniref:Uncharacterized protein n=1 Tax=Penicillium canescens TaxID=5083 RepID=A0AAD6HYN1_PENCN|nr:uncharacterized protein N7446_013242 [Penicillium canescens]KAJ5985509.1 hypothetical protein N7522_012705 [Penicillium canescens]KAJ6022889.1 hypothetical protein N7460_013284 [Penicillium canescens]KAJ6025849.1 hypothetical protein N7444_013528 [Penicillium canescens]KAJ6042176.1 hypothetical protein N7446_013242 [Penicillium canescens]KAJ6076226.1 hypothetical protein N7499_008207 [Penicillium canescens]
MSDPSAELQSALRNLSIGEKGSIPEIARPTKKTAGPSTRKPVTKKRKPVADSWEDEADSDSEAEPESEQDVQPRPEDAALSPALSAGEGPLDPPPTPISPQTSNPWGARARASSPASKDGPARRPEKQTAVASRLIAGALGIRAPKRTEEQRAYDRSVKEQEIRRRKKEKEEEARAQEENEKAKNAVWDN